MHIVFTVSYTFYPWLTCGSRLYHDRMVVANNAYHYLSCKFESRSWQGVLDTTLCSKLYQLHKWQLQEHCCQLIYKYIIFILVQTRSFISFTILYFTLFQKFFDSFIIQTIQYLRRQYTEGGWSGFDRS